MYRGSHQQIRSSHIQAHRRPDTDENFPSDSKSSSLADSYKPPAPRGLRARRYTVPVYVRGTLRAIRKDKSWLYELALRATVDRIGFRLIASVAARALRGSAQSDECLLGARSWPGGAREHTFVSRRRPRSPQFPTASTSTLDSGTPSVRASWRSCASGEEVKEHGAEVGRGAKHRFATRLE